MNIIVIILVMICCLSCCYSKIVESQADQQSQGSTSYISAPVAAHSPVLTSLLLAALATANPTLTNTLLLTNPYLATYFIPNVPGVRYPIYGYTPISAIQDSSAYGTPYKRDTRH